GELARTRLVKGPNPLLLKVSGAGPVTVRMLAGDYGPAKGVRVKALGGDAMAEHAVLPVRGFLFSQKTTGSTAAYFLKRFGGEAKAVPEKLAAGRNEELRALAESGSLTVAEAIWLDSALQRENAVAARVALARALAGSFPDSAGVLDHAAAILQSAGTVMGDSEGREAEEARHWREHALGKMPESHQHLLALCHFFIEHDLVDQAFEKIKACVAAWPESPLAQAELGAIYQRKQFYVEAEKCYEKAVALDEAYLPRLIGFHEAFGSRVRARELRQKLIERGVLSLEAQLDMALRRGDLAGAEKNLEQQEKHYPERKDELAAQKIRLLEEKGDLKEAYKLQKKLYESQPRYHANKSMTLNALVELAVRLGKDDEAQALLRAYLKDHPGDVALRQRLSELQGKVLPHWWEPYDVKVAAIDTSRFDNKNYPTANHAWIVDFMVTRVLPDLSSDSYVHIAQKVLNLQGINELSELLVRAQRQDLLFVRTLNPDGSMYEPQNMHDFNLAQSASLYKVGPGSILEHAYVMHTAADEDDPSLTMGFNFNAIDAPRAVSRWVVMIPDEVKSKLDIRKIRPEIVDEKILPGPPGHTVYQWTNTQVEGIKLEPLMPTENDQEVIPLVIIESKDRPYRANNWLMRREKPDIPPEAMEQARRIVAGGLLKNPDDAARFDAIVTWVWRNIQPGDDSRTLTDVWFARAGRPDQMTELALAMSRSVGLKVRMAYANGSYAPGRVFKPKTAERAWEPMELANFGSAGRMLVLEQESGPDRWAGFGGRTPKYSWPMDLNRSQPGAVALTLGDDGARIKRVHGEELGLIPSTHRVEVALDDKGTGTVTGTLLMFGPAGSAWREALADPRRQSQAREWVVRHAWPKGQTGDVKVLGEPLPQLPLKFTYSCVVKELAAQAGDALFLPPFLNKPHLLDLRGPAERQNDMLLKEEWADLDQTVTYVAPEGHGWVEVPDDLFICTEFGFYLVDFNVQGRTLTCTRSYLLPMQRIIPGKYRHLLEFLQQVSDSQQRIAYGPLRSESFGTYKRDVYSMGYAGCGEKQTVMKGKD
ncbi:MAG: hypothetical protein NTW87_09610, partial [Planctomycetota bacterium]|nr:hypothetical protein [Planctomycetota bacterium]